MGERSFGTILVGRRAEERGEEAVALGRALGRAGGGEVEEVTVVAGEEAAGGLAALARQSGAGLIVLGPSHRGALGRVVPGATAEHLLGIAPCPVAVATPGFGSGEAPTRWQPPDGDGPDAGLRVIGVGFDGGATSRRALELATWLALANGAALRVYAVARRFARVPGSEVPAQGVAVADEIEALRLALHEAVGELPSETRALPVFLRGLPADELLGAVEVGVDLLAIGSRTGGPLRRAAHGSVSSHLIAAASCPVLVVPAAQPPA